MGGGLCFIDYVEVLKQSAISSFASRMSLATTQQLQEAVISKLHSVGSVDGLESWCIVKKI